MSSVRYPYKKPYRPFKPRSRNNRKIIALVIIAGIMIVLAYVNSNAQQISLYGDRFDEAVSLAGNEEKMARQEINKTDHI